MVNTTIKVSVIVASLFLILAVSFSTAFNLKRSTPQICSRTTPCGWEVYRPYIRTVEYFVASPCECPVETRCVRTSDDLSISAYVHRCREDQENNETSS